MSSMGWRCLEADIGGTPPRHLPLVFTLVMLFGGEGWLRWAALALAAGGAFFVSSAEAWEAMAIVALFPLLHLRSMLRTMSLLQWGRRVEGAPSGQLRFCGERPVGGPFGGPKRYARFGRVTFADGDGMDWEAIVTTQTPMEEGEAWRAIVFYDACNPSESLALLEGGKRDPIWIEGDRVLLSAPLLSLLPAICAVGLLIAVLLAVR